MFASLDHFLSKILALSIALFFLLLHFLLELSEQLLISRHLLLPLKIPLNCLKSLFPLALGLKHLCLSIPGFHVHLIQSLQGVKDLLELNQTVVIPLHFQEAQTLVQVATQFQCL